MSRSFLLVFSVSKSVAIAAELQPAEAAITCHKPLYSGLCLATRYLIARANLGKNDSEFAKTIKKKTQTRLKTNLKLTLLEHTKLRHF